MNDEQQQLSDQQLNKAERKRLRQAENELRRQQQERRQTRSNIARWALVALIPVAFIGWITWKIVTSPVRPEGDVVSRTEVHWHAKLDITVRGQDVVIPANIGIPLGNPTAHPENMHTHAEDHIVHIEKLPPVYKNDLRIGNFFNVWGKRFDSQCVADECTEDAEKLTMTVNGQTNTDFENYLLKDGDKVEITLQ